MNNAIFILNIYINKVSCMSDWLSFILVQYIRYFICYMSDMYFKSDMI